VSSPRRKRLLILGGTGEARELASLAGDEFHDRLDVITSLAGRTAAPAPLKGRIRRGGFSGTAGLAAFLRDEPVDLVIDATHPFAMQISQHAVAAAAEVAVPYLSLSRPAWRAVDGDRWLAVPDAAAAAARLASMGRRVWLTVGSGDLAAFVELSDTWFLIRRVEPPSRPIQLSEFKLILGRGPFALAEERRLIADYRIDVLVCRASGGAGGEAKLTAAREASLPVVMIARPPQGSVPTVETTEAAMEWLRAQVNS
jgi:precorrin-6A/cobalt-precorrin-6A reductase